MHIRWHSISDLTFLKYFLTAIFVFLFLQLQSCGSVKDEIQSISALDTLAVIGDRLITVQDFYRRAEYTPRPNYCNGTNYIHKKIILNSLIAEKLLALDSENDEQFKGNSGVDSYLVGRREQAMRQIYFYDKAFKVADPEPEEIQSAYKKGNRTVKVQYFNIPGPSRAVEVKTALDDGITFDEIYSVFSNSDSIPKRELSWMSKAEDPLILSKIFNDDMAAGQIIGPVTAGDGSILLIKIEGWRERILISEPEQQKHWDDVREKLVNEKALALYESQMKELMAGKELIFNPEIYFPYAQSLAGVYLRTQEQTETLFEKSIWNSDRTFSPQESFPEQLRSEEFFSFEGTSYSVSDFEKMLSRRPLVFRNKKLSLSQFPNELQTAVADLLQDEVLTEECYRLGYNSHPDVISNELLWKDALVADGVKWNHISSITDTSLHRQEPIKKIEAVLNPVVRELQLKYSDRIRINMDAFEETSLTSTPMSVIQPGMPYPVIVPQFPVITTLSRLDYGENISK